MLVGGEKRNMERSRVERHFIICRRQRKIIELGTWQFPLLHGNESSQLLQEAASGGTGREHGQSLRLMTFSLSGAENGLKQVWPQNHWQESSHHMHLSWKIRSLCRITCLGFFFWSPFKIYISNNYNLYLRSSCNTATHIFSLDFSVGTFMG